MSEGGKQWRRRHREPSLSIRGAVKIVSDTHSSQMNNTNNKSLETEVAKKAMGRLGGSTGSMEGCSASDASN